MTEANSGTVPGTTEMEGLDSEAQAGIETADSEDCQEAPVQQSPAQYSLDSHQQDATLQPLPEQNAAPHLPPLMLVSEEMQPQPSEHTPAALTHPDQQNRCAKSSVRWLLLLI